MDQKEKWNSRYQERLSDLKKPTPNSRLTNLSYYLKGGIALDLACGLGGNSMFLAEHHYDVHALDISDIAINYIKEQAAKQKLPIDPMQCDLADLDTLNLNLKKEFFDLVVITYYLDRNILPYVKTLIKENGYVFMETFYLSKEDHNGHISNQFKLQPQELLHEFSDWKVLYYEENEQDGRQTIFCQKNL